MKILILGGGGMVGQKLVKQILESGLDSINPSDIYLYDLAFPKQSNMQVNLLTGDLGNLLEIKKLAGYKFDLIFHLAAIVSGEAEENFDKGWHRNINLYWHK